MRAVPAMFLVLCCSTALAASVSADRLVYRVSEPGQTPYISRILVTDNHVRLDEGGDAGGFVLYDREQRIIHSVVPEDQSVLVIDPRVEAAEAGNRFRIEIKRNDDSKAPPLAGRQPRHLVLMVNDRICEQRVVVPGLMKRALEGVREYLGVLAKQQAASSSAIPADMQSDCDLVRHVYHPGLMLEEGLAIQQWWEGRREELIDFAEGAEIPAALMRIPDGLERRSMDNPTGRP